MKALALGAALLTAAGTFAFRYLSFDSFSNDHYQHLARAQQILMGALPVRDFVESGLPLMAGLSAAAQVVFGTGLHSEVLWIALAFAIAAVLSFVAAYRLTQSIMLAFIGTLVTVVAFPVSYSYPKLLPYAAAFVAGWWYAVRPSPVRTMLLAAVVVFAFLLRHDHGLILALGSVALIAVSHGSARSALAEEAWFVLVGLLLVSPWLIWIQLHGGIGAYAETGLAISRREASKAVWTPPGFSMDRSQPMFAPTVQPWRPVINVRWTEGLSEPDLQSREREHGLTRREKLAPNIWRYEISGWSSGVLRDIVQDPAVADTNGIDRSGFSLQTPAPGVIERMLMQTPSPGAGLRPLENGTAALYYLSWLLPLFALLILWRAWRVLPPPVRALVVMAVVVQILMSRSMLRDPLVTRVRDVVAPFALLLPFIIMGLWKVPRTPVSRVVARAVAVVVLVLTIWASAAAGSFGERIAETGVRRGWEGMRARVIEIREELAPPRERTGRIDMPIVEYLRDCTPAGGRLFTMTFAPELFFFTGRGFAAGHESLLPGLYEMPRDAEQMLQRLSAEDVPFVVMDSDTEQEMGVSHPRIVEYVRKRYREVERFPAGSAKQLIVLAETTRRPVRIFGKGRLPCFASANADGSVAAR